MKTRKMSFEKKLVSIFLIFYICLMALTMFVMFYFQSEVVMKSVRKRMYMTMDFIAKNLDAEELRKIKGEGTPEYEALRKLFQTYLEAGSIENIYVLQKNALKEYCVLVTAEDNLTAGRTYIIDENLQKAFAGERTDIQKSISSMGEEVYCAYCPVFDENNEVIAVIGSEYSNKEVKIENEKFLLQLAIVAVIRIVVLMSAIMVFGKIFHQNIVALSERMKEIVENKGDLRKKVNIDSGDEFEVIADNFNAMLSKICTTVYKIKMKLYELKREIGTLQDCKDKQYEKAEEIERIIVNIEKIIKNKDIQTDALWEKVNEVLFLTQLNREYIKEQNEELCVMEEKVRVQKRELSGTEEKKYDEMIQYMQQIERILEISEKNRYIYEDRFIQVSKQIIELQSNLEQITQEAMMQEKMLEEVTEQKTQYSQSIIELEECIEACAKTESIIEKEIEMYII